MTTATDVARLWARTIIAQFDDGIDFGQSDVDEFFRLARADQKQLAATSVAMFAAILDEVVRLEADVHVWLWIPLPERAELPVGRQSEAELLELADFTGRLAGRSVPGFVLEKRNPGLSPIAYEEYRTVVESTSEYARPVSTTLRLHRWSASEPFTAELVYNAYASWPPLAESTFTTRVGGQ
jgi:hypothetical protein